MSGKDRRSYLSATNLNQALLDYCSDNFETRIEMIVDIEKPGGDYIRASDRNKYVGNKFYQALLKFPTITRTLGEWLSPTLQFSTIQLELNNSDGRFNKYLPGGAEYNSFIGKKIVVKIGLAEQETTYQTIFRGKITDVGGFSRSTYSVTFIARDNYEQFSVVFPNTALSRSVYPNLDDGVAGKTLPVIYGDFTTGLDPDPAIIPAYVLNGNDPNVVGGTRSNLQLRIAAHDLLYFDANNVYLSKGDFFYQCPVSDVVNVASNNNYFEIKQNTSNKWAANEHYNFEKGDVILVRVKGKNLGSYNDNIIAQAKDILTTYGGASPSDFDSNWDTYRDKSTPAKSAIKSIKSRIWEDEPKPVIEYVLSLLEQVRLEAFIDNELKLKINSLHFEDWQPSPSFTIKNWDIVEKTLKPKTDEKNNFNRAQATFDFHPNRNEQAKKSHLFHNQDSYNQIGKFISKKISFPNLYIESDVEYQLIEILRISSSLFEIIEFSATWRSLLLDVGSFISLNVEIGSTVYNNVPCMIRTKGYDPQGITIPLELWSMQLLPFPGYNPGYNGTVGGHLQNIIQE